MVFLTASKLDQKLANARDALSRTFADMYFYVAKDPKESLVKRIINAYSEKYHYFLPRGFFGLGALQGSTISDIRDRQNWLTRIYLTFGPTDIHYDLYQSFVSRDIRISTCPPEVIGDKEEIYEMVLVRKGRIPSNNIITWENVNAACDGTKSDSKVDRTGKAKVERNRSGKSRGKTK